MASKAKLIALIETIYKLFNHLSWSDPSLQKYPSQQPFRMTLKYTESA